MVRAQVDINPLDGRLMNRKTGYNINIKDVDKIEAKKDVTEARDNKETVDDVKEIIG